MRAAEIALTIGAVEYKGTVNGSRIEGLPRPGADRRSLVATRLE